MKKNEIVEFLKDLADDADIDEVVKGNENLAKLFEKGLTIEDVKNFLDSSEDGKKYLQQYGDSRVTKGIETFKANNLQKLIDEAIAKSNPEETPEQKKIRELQERIDKSERESARKDLKAKAIQIANDKKVPLKLVDYFLGQDEETTTKNLDAFNEIFNTSLSAAIEEKIKGGYKPPSNPSEPVDESKMSDAEWFKYKAEKQK